MDAVEHVQSNESRLEAVITSEESKNAGIRKPAHELEVKDGGIGAEEVQTETGKRFEWLISHVTGQGSCVHGQAGYLRSFTGG